MVAHACNPSCLEGRNWEDFYLRSAGQNAWETPSLFLFYGGTVLEFELRASCLLGRLDPLHQSLGELISTNKSRYGGGHRPSQLHRKHE
jgi:hypothetical protein